MNETITVYAQADKSVYLVVRNGSNEVWQTTTNTFVTYADADAATYAVATTEQGTSSGVYLATFPVQIAAGTYSVASYLQLSTTPASTDALIDAGEFVWGGIGQQGTTEYTDAQLIVEYRAALAAVATNQSYSMAGRTYTRANLKEIRDTIDWLERKISSTNDTTGGLLYVRFNRA